MLKYDFPSYYSIIVIMKKFVAFLLYKYEIKNWFNFNLNINKNLT